MQQKVWINFKNNKANIKFCIFFIRNTFVYIWGIAFYLIFILLPFLMGCFNFAAKQIKSQFISDLLYVYTRKQCFNFWDIHVLTIYKKNIFHIIIIFKYIHKYIL